MVSFVRVKNTPLNQVALVADQVLFEEATGYLYVDLYNSTTEEVERQVLMAPVTAEDTTYDNTDSGLTATDVQGAIDELSESYEVIDFSVDPDTGELKYTTGNAAVTGNGWTAV